MLTRLPLSDPSSKERKNLGVVAIEAEPVIAYASTMARTGFTM